VRLGPGRHHQVDYSYAYLVFEEATAAKILQKLEAIQDVAPPRPDPQET
jgi:hypothetical protein